MLHRSRNFVDSSMVRPTATTVKMLQASVARWGSTPAPAGQEWQQTESWHSGTFGTFQSCWARQYFADDASAEPIMFCTFTSDQVIYRTDLIIWSTSHIREKIIAIFISISCLTWPVVTTHFAYSLSSGNLIEIFLSNSLRFVLCPEVLLSLFPSGTY